MKDGTKGTLLVGAGFLLGTLGVKALTSQPARKAYVQGVACGIRAKNAYQDIVEEAKAQVDDIVAEATYLTEGDEAEEAKDGNAKPAAKPAKAPAKKQAK